MDAKLRLILDNFSMQLHDYEEDGGDLPEAVDQVWIRVSDLLMEENEE